MINIIDFKSLRLRSLPSQQLSHPTLSHVTRILHCEGHPVGMRSVQRQHLDKTLQEFSYIDRAGKRVPTAHLVRESVQQAWHNDGGNKLRRTGSHHVA
jgi:hypothetical protein